MGGGPGGAHLGDPPLGDALGISFPDPAPEEGLGHLPVEDVVELEALGVLHVDVVVVVADAVAITAGLEVERPGEGGD